MSGIYRCSAEGQTFVLIEQAMHHLDKSHTVNGRHTARLTTLIEPSARADYTAAQAAGPLCTVCGYASIRWIGDTGEEMIEVSAGPDRQSVHVHPTCLKTDAATFGNRLAVALGILPEEV